MRSANGQQAYCSDLTLVCRFLHEGRGGKTIWEMTGTDLRALKQARLFAADPDERIEVVTWNRMLALLDKWVAWSLDAELLAEEPFRYVDKVVMTPQGLIQVRVNAEAEPGQSDRPITFLPYEDHLPWRDVGLRGFLPDGGCDPKGRGRNGERNALFADLLVCTGMRLTEASCLLVLLLESAMRRGCDVGEWRTDPTFAMCRALVDGAELSSFVGGPFDVRAVVAAIRPEATDGFLLDEVPWEHFPQEITSEMPFTCRTPATLSIAPERAL
ncbi:hypothetical protein AB0L85_15555 [Streptomyces sp. NPDC052051]|uniref:hypothetical protein n=1 Tax=Streptomyces sp. NPDC052051 TaxID=3154649 RepID=UPI0034477161